MTVLIVLVPSFHVLVGFADQWGRKPDEVALGRYLTVQHSEDSVENSAAFLQHFVIPEPQNGIALIVEPARSRQIRLRRRMLATIELDDQHLLATEEIDNVRTERHLTGEFMAVQEPVSKVAPQAIFGFLLILTKIARLLRFTRSTFDGACRPACGFAPLIRPFGPPSPRRGEEGTRGFRLRQCSRFPRIR
jgi:hypothetical protein